MNTVRKRHLCLPLTETLSPYSGAYRGQLFSVRVASQPSWQVMLTTDQHYISSSTRPQVQWMRQVGKGKAEDSMCCDSR